MFYDVIIHIPVQKSSESSKYFGDSEKSRLEMTSGEETKIFSKEHVYFVFLNNTVL